VPGVEPLNGIDSVAGRLTFLAKPTDDLTATLKLLPANPAVRPTALMQSTTIRT